MIVRIIPTLFVAALLAACAMPHATPASGQAATPAAPVGTAEWRDWVSRATGVIDPDGHGPDPGSTEWCHAVHRKTTGRAVDASVTCDAAWEQRIDRELRGASGLSGARG